MAPDEARRQALIRFGGVEQMRERTRDVFRAGSHRASRARRPLRPALAAPPSRLHCDGRAVARDRHRRKRGDLRRGSTPCSSATPRSLTPRRSSTSTKPKAGRGFNPMSHPNIEDLRRGTTDVFRGIAASTFSLGGDRSRRGRHHDHGRGRDGRCVCALRHRARNRQSDSARGRCRAGRASSGDAQPRLLAARLRRRPAGRRTHTANGTTRLHHHRRRAGRLSRRPPARHASLLRADGDGRTS